MSNNGIEHGVMQRSPKGSTSFSARIEGLEGALPLRTSPKCARGACRRHLDLTASALSEDPDLRGTLASSRIQARDGGRSWPRWNKPFLRT